MVKQKYYIIIYNIYINVLLTNIIVFYNRTIQFTVEIGVQLVIFQL